MSNLILISDAVTDFVNAGAFSEPVAATRKHLPIASLEDLANLRVTVAPRSNSIAPSTRAKSTFDIVVDIGVQQHIHDDARIDELLTLVEEIVDHLRLKRLPAFPEAAWVSIENDPVLASDHLDTKRIFTSVISVTYRMIR